jgi:hypothetical protein
LTRELLNIDKYISQDILKQCFEIGKHNVVDKVVCGNGFSTAFLMLPPPKGKHNIIIVPNKAVIISKENAFKRGEIDTKNRITFHYSEGTDVFDAPGDILMFVADTFNIQYKLLLERRESIGFILIDEAHTIEQGASYRYRLRGFYDLITPFLEKSAVVSVTATPNKYSPVDIRIINSDIQPKTIHFTGKKVATINRIKKLIKKGKKVYVATNDWNIIYILRNARNREIEANFIIGDNMYRSLVDKVKIIHNEDSNLVIGSSRSFEGMDLMGKDWNVFFFESRGRDFETFYISNLYQAINRPREGTSYIEYCRSEGTHLREYKITNKSIDRFISDDSKSTENKMKKIYKDFHPYVIFKCNNETGFWSIKKDYTGINLLEEAKLYDAGFTEFKDFLDVRKLSIKNLNEAPAQIGYPKIKTVTKVENLLRNKDLIKEKDLFGDDYRLDCSRYNKPIDFIKRTETYFRNKNYDGNYIYLDRELKGREMLSLAINKDDYNPIDVIRKKAIVQYNKWSKNDSNNKGQRDKALQKFKDLLDTKIRKLIVLFINKRIKEPYAIAGNRQYSNIVQCPTYLIQDVCTEMGITFTQIDLRTAFSRIIYALNGLELPENFYGENKKNKKYINIFLNNFFYDPKKGTDKKNQKYEAKRRFKRYGFDDKVINWLIDNYFECKYRGDFFNYLTWHEKKIMEEVKNLIDMNLNDGCIRKHDELMLFNNTQDLSFLNDFEYLGQKGWFNIESKIEKKIVEIKPKKVGNFRKKTQLSLFSDQQTQWL